MHLRAVTEMWGHNDIPICPRCNAQIRPEENLRFEDNSPDCHWQI